MHSNISFHNDSDIRMFIYETLKANLVTTPMRLTRLDPFSIINLMKVPTNGEANIHLLKITRKQING